MSMEITAVALLGTLVSVLAGTVTAFLKKYFDARLRRDKRELLGDATRRVTEFGVNIAGLTMHHTIEHDLGHVNLANELLRDIEGEIASQASSSQASSPETVRREIDSRINELKARLQTVEDRFPEKSSIDKIASINDALFAERIDQLAARIEGLEKKLISKWDVAVTVCLIIAGIFAVVGATYAVLRVFGLLGGAAA